MKDRIVLYFNKFESPILMMARATFGENWVVVLNVESLQMVRETERRTPEKR